ncbi:MAG: hypothetical protein LBF42_01435 [Puniceicoccales bacterium]|jgi:hypothetical protein|nr:hypothetical protein [Puniceicoccales bacterium]
MVKNTRFSITAKVACAIAALINPCKGTPDKTFTWDENSHLVQVSDRIRESATGLELIEANPAFVDIMADLHFLTKRSYRSTKRDANEQYEALHMLEQDDLEIIPGTMHSWYCIKNFQGQQGTFATPNIGWRIVKCILLMFAKGNLITEVDYPGFVAYRTDYNCGDDIIWLVVVLRGSQGEDFQPLGGILGSSWVTNLSAGAASLSGKRFPFAGEVHSGYLNKMLACEISMKNSINEALENIGPENFHRVRFIVTGHSQGGGLAQIALPMIIKDFSYIYGQDAHGAAFKNSKTPRFFGYFVSAPRISCGEKTAKAFTKCIGKHNMIRHEAHGDIVPMLCMPNYYPLGVLALDTFYDVFCRSIRSEIAHCSLGTLFNELKNLFDLDKFEIDDNVWTAKDDPNFKMYWTEVAKVAKTTGSRHTFRTSPSLGLFKGILKQGFLAANPPREFEEAKKFPDVSSKYIEGLMKEWYTTKNIELLVKHFALFEDVKLDEKRKEKIFMISDQMEQWLGNGETFGIISASSCVNCLNAVSETANSMKGLSSKNFEKYTNVIEGDTVSSGDTLSPIAGISAVAIAHFGSHSNFYGTSLFDRHLPSKDINLSLRNGAELLRTKKKGERCIFIYEEGLPKILVEICQNLETSNGDE